MRLVACFPVQFSAQIQVSVPGAQIQVSVPGAQIQVSVPGYSYPWGLGERLDLQEIPFLGKPLWSLCTGIEEPMEPPLWCLGPLGQLHGPLKRKMAPFSDT